MRRIGMLIQLATLAYVAAVLFSQCRRPGRVVETIHSREQQVGLTIRPTDLIGYHEP